MFGEGERPARIRAEQDRALITYLRSEVWPYSDLYRRRLDDAGLERGRIRTRAEFEALPPVALADLADPVPLVLRPDATRIRAYGGGVMRARLQAATTFGRQPHLARNRIDPIYKPVHWVLADGLPVASSAADLDRLGELGRRWLESAGVRPDDVVVSLVPPGPSVGFWQLALGARRSSLSALFLAEVPSPAELDYLRPTVLAGPVRVVEDLARAAIEQDRSLGSVHTILVIDPVYDPAGWRRLGGLLPGAAVVPAWAPAGARALWAQCRGGGGLHTWPATEIVEVVTPGTGTPEAPGRVGEILWTGLGWHGTALLRLRTGAYGTIRDDACPDCSRTSPRVEILTLPRLLDAEPEISDWQLELGPGGVFAFVTAGSANGDLGASLAAIDRQTKVDQFVVLDAADLDERIAAHAGARVLGG